VSPSVEIEQLGCQVMPDAEHRRHFGHHFRFRDRNAGTSWTYHRIRVPIESLLCRYGNVGEGDYPGGLGAILGLAASLIGVDLRRIAERIRERIAEEPVIAKHPLIQKVGSLAVLGTAGIYQLPQPLMLEPCHNGVDVIEGNHRYLALILLGETRVDGFDWSRITPTT